MSAVIAFERDIHAETTPNLGSVLIQSANDGLGPAAVHSNQSSAEVFLYMLQ